MKTITATILTIGDEILYGQITDTNSQWISAELDKIGIKTIRKVSVGDQETEILEGLAYGEMMSDIVLITGGLGPTKDDITKRTICDYFGDKLILNESVEAHVRGFFEKRGRPFTDLNRGQAFVPSTCEIVFNQNGTAPGMWFSKSGKVFVSMPGVPFEMKAMVKETVIPKLISTFNTPIIFHKIIQTVGIGESFLAEKISAWEDQLPSHIKLAYLPSSSMVKLRLTGFGNDKITLEKDIMNQVFSVLPTIEKHVFGYDDDTIESVLGKYLLKDNKTIATAESCTGGMVAATLTSVPGSSGYYFGSVIAYSNEIKINELGVNPDTINTFGAVSEETAKEMAEGVRKKLNTSIGISTTGIAGPGGGTEEKPVGTVWVAYSDERRTVARKLQLGKLRDVNIRMSVISCLNMAREILKYE